MTIRASEESRRARSAGRRAELAARPPETVVLVSCGAKKRGEKAAARDLYTSALFRKARAFAEARGDRWFVISALHKLVSPDRVLEPYNFKLTQLRGRERDAWGEQVAREISGQVPPGSKIIVLAGKVYRDPLVWRLSGYGYDVETPTAGMGLFELMHYLTESTK